MMQEQIIFLFIDGIGFGQNKITLNPLLPLFKGIVQDYSFSKDDRELHFPMGFLSAIDATMGVAGLPQSATGQTSLFTGINAQKHLGYHLHAMPSDPLIDLLQRRSLFSRLKGEGVTCCNANIHSAEYFALRRGGHKNRFPASTIMTMSSRTSFLFKRDYIDGRGIFMDITGALLKARGWDLPTISPQEAAGRLISLNDEKPFVFFEYFLTDKWGHKRKREHMDSCVYDLQKFLGALYKMAIAQRKTVILVSDHGNSEDAQSADHTMNPVPFLYFSGSDNRIAWEDRPQNLCDVYDRILSLYGIN